MDLIKSLETNFCIQQMSYDFSGKKMALSDDQGNIRIFSIENSNFEQIGLFKAYCIN